MNLVGLVSSYKEGRLIHGCIDSLLRMEPNRIYVFEGQAGADFIVGVPETDLCFSSSGRVTTHLGRWRSDARKRQKMLERAKADYPDGPLWGMILDADEVLVNGEYVRDLVQALQWEDEAKPGEQPWARYPLRLIEADGSISFLTGRLVRLDLIRRYHASTSAIENVRGIKEGWGNVVQDSRIWLDHFLGAVDRGRMTAWPPLPCEPHVFHRSHLRHPARRGLRMHVQEAVELAKLEGAS